MAVPEGLRAIVGKRELVRSLRTKHDAEARKRAPSVCAEFTNTLAAARGDARALTLAEIDGLCGKWSDEQMAKHGDDPGDAHDWDAFVGDQTEKWHGGDDRDTVEPTADDDDRRDARVLLAVAGIRADAASAARLAQRLVRTKYRFGREMLRRLTGGNWSPPPHAFPPAPSARPAPSTNSAVVTFDSLIEGYARAHQRNARARYDRERTLERLRKFLGHDDAARVTSDDAIRFKEARLDEVGVATVRNDISELSGIWKWAARNKKVAANPFTGIAPPKAKATGGKRKRVPYDGDDAKRLLEAARKEKGLLRWLRWLLCFTGARIGELAQAAKADVTLHDSGYWVLRIHAEHEGSTLKTEHSERFVPLHPALIAEGFARYVEGLPKGSRLWPDLKPSAHGLFGDYASKKHGRWVRATVGITDTQKDPAHAWRHWFEGEARRASIPREVVDGLLGHYNPKNEGDGYGRGHRFMPEVAAPHVARMHNPLESAPATAPDAPRDIASS